MKIGDCVKRKGKPWHPLDSWYIKDFVGNRAHLIRRDGCGISATTEDIDKLELIN